MVQPTRIQARFQRGDRVRTQDGTDGSVGVVVGIGAHIDADSGQRSQLLKVLWPIGSTHGAAPIWMHEAQLAMHERPCVLCHGEDYLDGDESRVLCPLCLGGAA